MGQEEVHQPLDRMDGDPVCGLVTGEELLAAPGGRVDVVEFGMIRPDGQRELALALAPYADR